MRSASSGSRPVGLGAVLAISAAGVFGVLAATGASGQASAATAAVDRVMSDPRIVESSALARSAYSTALWTSNDSGGGPVLYVIGAGGATIATYTVPGASALDWEAMAAASKSGRHYLYIGDVGDNGKKRATIALHQVVEPTTLAKTGSLAHVTWTLRYPDGPHNAETILVDPRTLQAYVVTKDAAGGTVYRLPAHPSTTGVNVLVKMGSAPVTLSDGAFLDDGRFVLRGYERAYLYTGFGATPTVFAMPQPGESITPGFTAGTVLTGEEGVRSTIWRVPLP